MGQKLSCNNLFLFVLLPKRFILFLLLLQHDIFIDFIHVAGIGLSVIRSAAITAIYIPLLFSYFAPPKTNFVVS